MIKRLLLLLALPLNMYAQKLELGLNVGTQYNLPTLADEGRFGGYMSVRVLHNINRHWQLGFAIDIGKLSFRSKNEYYIDETMTEKGKIEHTYGDPYIAPNIVLNYRINIRKGYFYGGINAGYFRAFKGGSDMTLVYIPMPGYDPWLEVVGTKISFGPYDWITLGLQAGYTLQLTGRLGCNAEVAYRRQYETERIFFMQRRDRFVPVSVGVRYRL